MATWRKATPDRWRADRRARARVAQWDIYTFSRRENRRTVEDLIAGARVEVIEVKRSLDRPVLGQVIVGADLLEMEYVPAEVDQVVVCEVGDPVLEAVCERHGIVVSL
jgi:hypothetical protein